MSDELRIIEGDSSKVLLDLEPNFSLIYIDPPFNTGRTQSRGDLSYEDSFEDYMGFMVPLLKEARRLLTPDGSFFIHIDPRESHYLKVELDKIFGRDCFQNEIIWAYDYGGRSKKKWSWKHDVIFWYTKDPKKYIFNYEEIDRIPYMAPGLVGPEKAAKGKVPTDCWTGDYWWHTIVHTNGKEKTSYPTQKPLGILKRIVHVHCNPGDNLLDFFAGSGSFGEAALSLGRKVVLIDNNPQAIEVMRKRLGEMKWSRRE